MKNTHGGTRDPPSQSSLKDYNSDLDDTGQESDPGVGFDARMNMDSSDPIESISDDDFYNDDDHAKYNDMAIINSPDGVYFDDIETFTDDDDIANGVSCPIPRKKFKPFKALEGLDQWRPDSAELLDAATRNANINNDTDTDKDSIEEIYSDMDLDTAKARTLLINDNSLDSIKSISTSPSPPPTTRCDSISGSMKNNSTTMTTPAPLRLFSHPTLSPYQNISQDTRKSSRSVKAPAFILDHTHNSTTNKSHLPIKKDGLASFALDCINQEVAKFREWQTSVLAEMAKHGSLSKVCMQDQEGRLCRILEMWVEHDMVFSWCVDLTTEERQQLLKVTSSKGQSSSQQRYQDDGDGDDDDDDIIMQHDSDTGISSSQPLPSLPTYEPNDDDRPYVCVFATTYLNGPRKNIISKLMVAEYIAIWAPWTTVPIFVDGAEMHVHIVTRFMMDDPRV